MNMKDVRGMMLLSKHIYFDMNVGFTYTLTNITRRLIQKALPIDNPLVANLNGVRIRMLTKWFEETFKTNLLAWHSVQETAIPFHDSDEAPIWMMWLDGVATIPSKFQPFIDSIKRNNPDRPLIIVDFDEVQKLTQVPEVILSRVRDGSLRNAHLSDVLRFLLLEKYGGVWFDLTIFQVRPIPDNVFAVPFWSVKDLDYFPYATAMPCGLKWQVYAMASQPHALFNCIMIDLYCEYWKRYDFVADYFLTYYLALLARSVPAVEKSYERVVKNNTKCEQVNALLQTKRPLGDLRSIDAVVSPDTWLYKGNSHLDSYMERVELRIFDYVATAIESEGETRSWQ